MRDYSLLVFNRAQQAPLRSLTSMTQLMQMQAPPTPLALITPSALLQSLPRALCILACLLRCTGSKKPPMKQWIFILLVGFLPLWGEEASPEACPLIDMKEFSDYAKQKVTISTPKKAKLGENIVTFSLEKNDFPSGYMVAGYADIHAFSAQTPPSIVDGFPRTTITLHEAGTYEFRLKLNLIYKSS